MKTRLAAAVGGERAAAIYRDLAEHTVNVARQVSDCGVVVCCDPAASLAAIAAWLGDGLEYRAQLSGDLGMRMAGAMGDALARGAQSVALIGTDCPGLDAALIDAAFAAIDPRAGAAAADVALGPARDGGYYLIAARQVHSALFGGIPWSTSETLGATLSAAAVAGLGVSLLDERR
ncbi:MAG TPA: TIGR04282 family arsenosugar biosynthesis glycosyltransferase, partial [Gemmatimonadaceae bacterium]